MVEMRAAETRFELHFLQCRGTMLECNTYMLSR